MVTGRVLRIELRRTSALWVGALFLVLGLALIFGLSGPWGKGGGAWNQQWTPLARWERYLLVFLWPLVLGAGAVQGMRDSRSGTGELLSTTPRPTWHRAAQTAAALAIGLTGGYAAIFLIGAAQVAGTATYLHLGWLPTATVGVLSVIGGAWLGMGIGRAAPSVVTPPLLAVAALVILVVDEPFSRAVTTASVPNQVALLSPVLGGARDAFTTVAGRVSLPQSLWFLGLAGTGFLLLAAKSARARLVSALPALLGVAVALPLFPAEASKNVEVDPAAVAMVCTAGDRICVRKVHEDLLDTVSAPALDALTLLAKLPGAPVAVAESLTPEPRYGKLPSTAGSVPIDLDDYDLWPGGRLTEDPERLRRYLVAGAGTPSCFSPVDQWGPKFVRERAARTVAAAWLTGDLKSLSMGTWLRQEVDVLARPAWQALRELPAAEQFARVAAMRTAALACGGDLLSILTEGVPT